MQDKKYLKILSVFLVFLMALLCIPYSVEQQICKSSFQESGTVFSRYIFYSDIALISDISQKSETTNISSGFYSFSKQDEPYKDVLIRFLFKSANSNDLREKIKQRITLSFQGSKYKAYFLIA